MNYNLILKFIYKQGGTGNVMEALGWDASKHEEGFIIANEMQNLNYVKLLYSNFNKNLIVVELTRVGIGAAK
ncbi:MAG: hypothetical protein OJF59_000564 [Cytophagales bacterium]|jgi:hypothetical protein|nr:hypothetical protein [Bacteroidota bacterium]MBS1981376.1 hypothetical protein [Bacteroidota bacterium]WHZ06811.1 MAG: hypothetical protein OJF59_000564 [Cytophagales bacterium]